MRSVFALCGRFFLLCLPLFAQTISEPIPEANPARPTVSTPATLTPVGYLQFETGSLGAVTSPEFGTRIGINQVTKMAVTPRLQLFVMTEPYVHSSNSAGQDRQIHPGEVFIGAQAVVLAGSGILPTVSVAYVRRLYESPAPELDLGTFRESGTLLLSNDMGGFHFDANFIVAEQTAFGTRRAQLNQTLSISHRLGKFTLAGEFWHFTQPYFSSYAVGNLWAVSRPLRRDLVIDGGLDHGFTKTSTHWEEFIGFTYLLPHRLWKR
ncbi:MAG: hypothetical protein JO307_13005 [Bryobacterales bacterium]|nr:hypothetical protein [Bryobacterales bacterium]MBV9399191.1 hypothetical protein [Bryobacterales bacterium]